MVVAQRRKKSAEQERINEWFLAIGRLSMALNSTWPAVTLRPPDGVEPAKVVFCDDESPIYSVKSPDEAADRLRQIGEYFCELCDAIKQTGNYSVDGAEANSVEGDSDSQPSEAVEPFRPDWTRTTGRLAAQMLSEEQDDFEGLVNLTLHTGQRFPAVMLLEGSEYCYETPAELYDGLKRLSRYFGRLATAVMDDRPTVDRLKAAVLGPTNQPCWLVRYLDTNELLFDAGSFKSTAKRYAKQFNARLQENGDPRVVVVVPASAQVRADAPSEREE